MSRPYDWPTSAEWRAMSPAERWEEASRLMAQANAQRSDDAPPGPTLAQNQAAFLLFHSTREMIA